LSTVLVTGGSGFIASHAILQLLAAGYRVRTTVRRLSREVEVRAMLKHAVAESDDRLSFVAADLMSDAGWPAAVSGCEYVLHIASPFPSKVPKDENELIVPAREGALRVLRAARDAGAKRVVMTSSFAAIGYGHAAPLERGPVRRDPSLKQETLFTEKDWTDPNGADVMPYTKSKTLAERAAWDFVEREGGGLEVTVVNPVAVFGPVLGPDFATSILLVQKMMDGALPGVPKMCLGVVDVRDVADLHLRAMTNPAAKGERFLAVAGDFMWLIEIAQVLKARMGEAAKRVPNRQLPDWVVRLARFKDPAVKQILPALGKW
jgi:dihydroflavonol-4-reductase